MLPPIVDDLMLLENGVPMYDHDRDKVVLVVSPLLFINADNLATLKFLMHNAFHC